MTSEFSILINWLNRLGEVHWRYAVAVFLQAGLLIAVIYAVDFLLRRRIRAVARYCLWMLVVVKLLLPPTLSAPVGIGHWLSLYPAGSPDPPAVSADPSDGHEVSADLETEVAPVPGRERTPASRDGDRRARALGGNGAVAADHGLPRAARGGMRPPADAGGIARTVDTGESETRATVIDGAPDAATAALTWQGWVLLIWLFGVVVLVMMLVRRVWTVHRLLQATEECSSGLRCLVVSCRYRIGLHRGPVTVRVSRDTISPLVCLGVFRPTLVVPSILVERLPVDRLQMIVLHELIHIKRGDLPINCLQTALQILFFYNPLLWFANGMIRQVREQAVDEAVLVVMQQDVSHYGNMLVDVAEAVFVPEPFNPCQVGIIESHKSLARRVRHIVSRPAPRKARLGIVGLLMVAVPGVVLLPMANPNASEESRDSAPAIVPREDPSDQPLSQDRGRQMLGEYYRNAVDRGDEEAMYHLGMACLDGRVTGQASRAAFEWFTKAARAGHAASMYQLALCYANGRGTDIDDALAFDWCRQAAKGGCIEAEYLLGEMYMYGAGVSRDVAAGVTWVQKAAEEGCGRAMLRLGEMYFQGQEVGRDRAMSFSWVLRGGQAGDPVAMAQAGHMYANGLGVRRNGKEAFRWCQRSAEAECGQGMHGLSRLYASGYGCPKDEARSDAWRRMAAEAGCRYAMLELGLVYLHGVDSMRSAGNGAAWIGKAAKAGDLYAVAELGRLYLAGTGVEQDPEHGVALIRESAQRDSHGMYCMGKLLWEGAAGLARDREAAVQWFFKAAHRGSGLAMTEIGVRYLDGELLGRDDKAAYRWLHQAAEAGDPVAMVLVSKMYATGVGVRMDHGKAREWCSRAVKAGLPAGVYRTGFLYTHEPLIGTTGGRSSDADAAARFHSTLKDG